jgi:hypothetical protein
MDRRITRERSWLPWVAGIGLGTSLLLGFAAIGIALVAVLRRF